MRWCRRPNCWITAAPGWRKVLANAPAGAGAGDGGGGCGSGCGPGRRAAIGSRGVRRLRGHRRPARRHARVSRKEDARPSRESELWRKYLKASLSAAGLRFADRREPVQQLHHRAPAGGRHGRAARAPARRADLIDVVKVPGSWEVPDGGRRTGAPAPLRRRDLPERA